MQARRIWWVTLLVLAVVLPGGKVVARKPDSLPYASPADLIAAVNALRASHGLQSYSTNSILMGTAQGQADFMASTGTIQHTGPGGISVTQRILNAGYPLAGDLSLGGLRSENIVGGYGMSPQAAVESWTGDAPHLNTMLSADLVDIGAGVAETGGMTYYVIDCAAPKGAAELAAYTPGAESQLNGGNDIIVPVKLSTPDANGNIVHQVQAGQTLWQIAIAYGVKINQIRQLNNLDPTSTVIQLGVKLLIKRIGTPTPASPTPTATAVLETDTPEPTPDLSTPTLAVIPTPTSAPTMAGSVGGTGVVAAIVVVAMLAAGLVAWAGRNKPV